MKSKQMSIGEPVSICGLRQNCFRREARTVDTDVDNSNKNGTIHKYPSLEKKVLPNGYLEVLENKDYPINAESVSSYADSANYRNDPAQAVANAPKRVNLGDVSEVQEFIRDNPQQAIREYREILSRLHDVLPQLAEIGKNVDNNPQPVDNGGEK